LLSDISAEIFLRRITDIITQSHYIKKPRSEFAAGLEALGFNQISYPLSDKLK